MSGHAAVSVYGRLTGDPRAIETRTGNPMTVGRLAVSLPCRENGEDGEAAAPRTPDPLLFAEPDRPEQPEPVPAGPIKITDADIPF